MSASNWAVCPRCLAEKRATHAELQRLADESYGVVSVDEFDLLRVAAAERIEMEALETFREDYEIYGASDGELTITYSGLCEKCGLSHSFAHEETFYEAW